MLLCFNFFLVNSFHTKIGCRMPALPRNPSSMTKERLAEELRRNNISLPSGRSKKEVYVELYKRHLLDNSPQLTAYRNMSVNTSPKIGFSSDEEDDVVEVQKKTRKPALNANNNRSQRKASKKWSKTLFEDRLAEVEELSDADLRKELQSRGVKAGPVIASTRGVYERKLADVLTNEEQQEEQEQQEENGESPEEMENGYSDSDVNEEDPDSVIPEEPQEQPVEQVESTRTSSYRSQTTEVVDRESSTRQRSSIQRSQVKTESSEKTQEVTKTSSEKTGERSKPLVPIWLQLVIFAIVATFLVLIWYNMETGQTDPTLIE